MYKNIFYAFCIAATSMSCGKGSESRQAIVSDVAVSEFENKKAATASPGIAAVTDSAAPVSSTSNDSLFNSGGRANIDWDKKIIKNAHVTMELKDYNTYNSYNNTN